VQACQGLLRTEPPRHRRSEDTTGQSVVVDDVFRHEVEGALGAALDRLPAFDRVSVFPGAGRKGVGELNEPDRRRAATPQRTVIAARGQGADGRPNAGSQSAGSGRHSRSRRHDRARLLLPYQICWSVDGSVAHGGTDGSQTPRWRKPDSNSQSHLNEKPFRGREIGFAGLHCGHLGSGTSNVGYVA
jgi:hypothetical protein